MLNTNVPSQRAHCVCTLMARIYEHFGVPEDWIVDPDMGRLEAHAMLNGRYGLRARYDRVSTLECPLFPGLAIGLMRVFVRR